ncbi:MAG: site-specific DNA-methyltransferase [Plesiomonas sp.]|uniref:site-specific DNA-methyltransferase n=1 Tax=Plesiomonas sp. TaxID=2486279 RepID=UPI003F3A8FA1
MDKLKMHSPDMTQQNIEKIQALFPNCVTESKGANGELKLAIDFDQLKQELSNSIVEGPQERYQLNWPGKREALLTANAPIAKTLRPCREESVNFDTTENLFIEGDNLDALKMLQETYLGKVKMIYIDPPYNTGSDFIYEDDFAQDSQEYLRKSIQSDEIGNKLIANYESNGRFHSDWMSMIYPRLRLARNLLSDDGVIFVSIGPEEVKNLLGILSEIFGEDNKISILTWEKGRKNDSTFFSESAEYMLVFARNKEFLASKGKWRERKEGIDTILSTYEKFRQVHCLEHTKIEAEMRKYYSGLEDDDPLKKLSHFYRADDRGLFFGADISSASTSIPDYEIIHPKTLKPVKKPSRGWGATEPVMLERIKNDEVLFGEDESTIPLKKSYLVEVDSIVKTPVFYKDGRAASGILKGLFGDVVFNNPKDHIVLSDIISYCLQGDKNALVLDFFAGSGSTAHAILELNSKDAGNRKFIMVQIPEELKPELATSPAAKQTMNKAIAFLKSNNKKLNIAEISKERIRRAGLKILDAQCNPDWNKDVGFRVLKIDSSNMADVYYWPDQVSQGSLDLLVDNIKADRTDEDLLFQVLLDWGVDLTLPIRKETIQGKTVFFVDDDALVACFDLRINEALIKELAIKEPLRVVFRDDGFKSDAVKINAEQIFKQVSPHTEVKAI